ncbi:hypothetical protein CERZMDRAFT_80530 [Cercospora zeae-maydis SCOH1-5]|uniref:Uncharacterized protein n=1 Tax=Cercospora zeae-maydis SCOH1-5 TaxID=717836 RepID=A0A6A6FWU5_9PEZI|nr:hypothetical protein CERZMDRAFT_80530 [Cercospora zeae-maydis SCOH1-5]
MQLPWTSNIRNKCDREATDAAECIPGPDELHERAAAIPFVLQRKACPTALRSRYGTFFSGSMRGTCEQCHHSGHRLRSSRPLVWLVVISRAYEMLGFSRLVQFYQVVHVSGQRCVNIGAAKCVLQAPNEQTRLLTSSLLKTASGGGGGGSDEGTKVLPESRPCPVLCCLMSSHGSFAQHPSELGKHVGVSRKPISVSESRPVFNPLIELDSQGHYGDDHQRPSRIRAVCAKLRTMVLATAAA